MELHVRRAYMDHVFYLSIYSFIYVLKWINQKPFYGAPWSSCSCGWRRADGTSWRRGSRHDMVRIELGLKHSNGFRWIQLGLQHSPFPDGIFSLFTRIDRRKNYWKSATPPVHSISIPPSNCKYFVCLFVFFLTKNTLKVLSPARDARV